MADEKKSVPKKPRYTNRVERGMILVLRELMEDNEHYALTDPQAPWVRRWKGKERKELLAALTFIGGMVERAQAKEAGHGEQQEVGEASREGSGGVPAA